MYRKDLKMVAKLNEDRLMDVHELADKIHYSPKTVRRMAKLREIPSYRGPGVSAGYRFILSEVLDALRQNATRNSG